MWLQRATPAAFYGKSQDERELVKGDAVRLIAETQDCTGILRLMGRASASSKRSRMLLVFVSTYFAPARTAVVPARAQLFKKMAKTKSTYSCTECGGQTLKWQGQCPHCQAWNTLIEAVAERTASRFAPVSETGQVQNLSEVEAGEEARYSSGIAEFDRVLGGGLVEGGVVLLGGDPGIGKSTLLLQALCHMSQCSSGREVLYVSGEESARQVALRARRMALDAKAIHLLAEIRLEQIQAVLAERKPGVAVIDSIQTIYSDALQSAPGSVAQVRECAAQLTTVGQGQRHMHDPGRSCH